mmetsp:Transcript_10267/g.21499  ORF Transcript_10267/g.21499 Transcript_10267/m.21499 type:complete len:541 (-) Transcript_10267:123-1745(-)
MRPSGHRDIHRSRRCRYAESTVAASASLALATMAVAIRTLVPRVTSCSAYPGTASFPKTQEKMTTSFVSSQIALRSQRVMPRQVRRIPSEDDYFANARSNLIFFSTKTDILLKSSLSSNNNASDPEDATTNEPLSKSKYIGTYLYALFLMCRPSNFPIVALFHVLGVHQAVQLWKTSVATSTSSSLALSCPSLKSVLLDPSIMMVLISLLLVTSTSMITNDYYDARNGVDAVQIEGPDKNSPTQNQYDHYHPLAQGLIPFSITKTFDSYLYAILLLSSALVPGVISRLFIIGGAIITYLYTVHLKPKTWIKNASCAALVSMSPVTSGLAAWHVLCNGQVAGIIPATAATASTAAISASATAVATTIPSLTSIMKSPLLFLVVALFAGIMSREILMDITDCEGDARAGITTVPVKYGREFASKVAFAWAGISSLAACGLSWVWLLEIWIAGVDFNLRSFWTLISSSNSFFSVDAWAMLVRSVMKGFANSNVRRLVLSLVGSGLMLQRASMVWKTKGENSDLAEKAIRESLFSVVLVLASFV